MKLLIEGNMDYSKESLANSGRRKFISFSLTSGSQAVLYHSIVNASSQIFRNENVKAPPCTYWIRNFGVKAQQPLPVCLKFLQKNFLLNKPWAPCIKERGRMEFVRLPLETMSDRCCKLTEIKLTTFSDL
jgi:hypothetical protein